MTKNHSLKALLAVSFALGFASIASAAVETYKIDPVHSSVGFGVRHFFTKVPGVFAKFAGTITVDRANLENSTAEATIEVPSVNTGNEKRDNHLRSADFFEAEKIPTITFKSKAWKKTGPDSFAVTGDLTIKGVTREVVLAVKSLGFGPGMKGAMLSGWEATTTFNRRDFGVDGPAMLATVVGDEVEVQITVEALLQK